jgi:hypothetical protein
MTGLPVRSLQTMLRRVAELDDAIPSVIPDGIYGRDTLAAVSAFQRTRKLPVTGVVDLTTWEAIAAAYRSSLVELAPPAPLAIHLDRMQRIEPGAHNRAIWVVQGVFAALSEQYANVPPVQHNGTNDALTQRAIRWLQAAADLPQSGALDRRTWQALARLYTASADIRTTNPTEDRIVG